MKDPQQKGSLKRSFVWQDSSPNYLLGPQSIEWSSDGDWLLTSFPLGKSHPIRLHHFPSNRAIDVHLSKPPVVYQGRFWPEGTSILHNSPSSLEPTPGVVLESDACSPGHFFHFHKEQGDAGSWLFVASEFCKLSCNPAVFSCTNPITSGLAVWKIDLAAVLQAINLLHRVHFATEFLGAIRQEGVHKAVFFWDDDGLGLAVGCFDVTQSKPISTTAIWRYQVLPSACQGPRSLCSAHPQKSASQGSPLEKWWGFNCLATVESPPETKWPSAIAIQQQQQQPRPSTGLKDMVLVRLSYHREGSLWVNGKLVKPLPPGNCVAFHPDGEWLALGHQNGEVSLWSICRDQNSGDIVDCVPASLKLSVLDSKLWDDVIQTVRFSPDGQLLVAASGSKLSIWGSQSLFSDPSSLPLCSHSESGWMPYGKFAIRSDNSIALGGKYNEVSIWEIAVVGDLLQH